MHLGEGRWGLHIGQLILMCAASFACLDTALLTSPHAQFPHESAALFGIGLS